jgi:hypothetical protein
MWASYGKQARKVKRGQGYTLDDATAAVKAEFSDPDVHMMCDVFLKVRRAELESRTRMDSAILAAYEKGQRAHTATNILHSHTEHIRKHEKIHPQT